MTNYILFDLKENWQNLLPFTYTRPVSSIRTGILTLKNKWDIFLEEDTTFLTEAYLQQKFPLALGDDNIFINSAVIPIQTLANKIKTLQPGQVIIKNEVFIAVNCKPEALNEALENEFKDFEKLECKRNPVQISHPWDIFSMNAEQIKADFEVITKGRESEGIPHTTQVLGEHPVFIEENATVECATLNTTDGPIYIGKDALVMEGAMIRGPFALCNNSQIKMGAKIYTGTTIGPHCKVGGEINNSVFQGFANKAHDGFLGNSVIGEWCNIGADSNNSNLKNNYENVKVWNYPQGRFIDTGLQFCGLFMGDHAKCGINTMFNTGTVVGVSSNIFGDGFPRTFIPSFSWGGAAGVTTYKIEKAFRTAELVMSRRDKELDEVERDILLEVFERSKKFRH